MSSASLIIGVDGGGTKTVAWLAPIKGDGTGTILGRGQSGPGNPRTAGFEVAQANIAAAIDAAFVDAKLRRDTAVAACFGLAGAGRAVEQQQIEAWATNQRIARIVRVTGDAEPILAAGSADDWGIALICGTGSLAWGRNREGQVARCGGWGYLLGDEGSAYAIARAGLVAAMRAADGRGPPTEILDRLQRQLATTAPDELIERIYAPDMSRERLAGLASIVFEAALQDPVAQSIVAAAAEDLAETIVTVADRLALDQFPLALTGSVILNQSALRDRVLRRIADCGRPPPTAFLVSEPVRGAIALARRLAAAG